MDIITKTMTRRKHVFITIGCLIIALTLISFAIFKRTNKENFRYDYKRIAERGYLKVIVEPNQMSYQTAGDSLSGLQVRMIEEFAKSKGLAIVFISETDLSKAISMLQNNEVDVLAWHIPVYNDMKEVISYTIPVFTSRQMLVQRKKDSKDTTGIYVNNQLELASRCIYIVPGTVFKQRLENLSREIGDSIYIEEIPNAAPENLVRMVADTIIDLTVCDEFVSRILKKEYTNIDDQIAVSFTQNYSWGVNQNTTELLDSLDTWLAVYLESKEYNTIYRHYTGVD